MSAWIVVAPVVLVLCLVAWFQSRPGTAKPTGKSRGSGAGGYVDGSSPGSFAVGDSGGGGGGCDGGGGGGS